MDDKFSSQVVVRNKLGIHGRRAGKIVQEAMKYSAEICIQYAQRRANAKSILEILMLAAAQGSSLILWAQGQDAYEAITSLTQLIQNTNEI
ncbi:MAG TPA: HPr family phosphocarrier protein [Desulfohalobiaceae bacterium]|nr:HPr family phosphocarrier protein [Desulfohalobiaceae bacterium]